MIVTVLFAQCTAPTTANMSLNSLYQLLRNKMSAKRSKFKWSGKLALVDDTTNIISIYDTNLNCVLHKLPHSEDMRYVIQLKNGLVATGCGDHCVHIWNISTGERVQLLKGTSSIYDMCELKDNRLIVESEEIIVFDMNDGSIISSTGIQSSMTSLVELRDSTLVMSGTMMIYTYNTETNERINVVPTNSDSYYSLIETKNGVVVGCGISGEIDIVDFRTGTCTPTSEKAKSPAHYAIALQEGGFAVLEGKGHVTIWNDDGTLIKKIEEAVKLFDSDCVAKIAEVENGIIACQQEKKLVFYNIHSGVKVREIEMGIEAPMMVRCFLK
jgi:WD40 repeat protein